MMLNTLATITNVLRDKRSSALAFFIPAFVFFVLVHATAYAATTSTPPQSLTATAGNASVSLSWLAPASDGSSSLTQYDVYDRFTGSSTFALYATTTPSETTSTVTSLTNGQSYDFEIVAENGVGSSTPSNIASTLPFDPGVVPDAPTGATATLLYPQATVTTLAGGVANVTCSTVNGTGSAAHFCSPKALSVDSAGNIFVSDNNDSTIRKITPAGVATSIAGAGITYQYGYLDGASSTAEFNGPAATVEDSAGNVYVADAGNCVIRKITPGGIVSTFVGVQGNCTEVDGTSSTARMAYPTGLAIDASGNLYESSFHGCTIRKITPDGTVSTIAGLLNSCSEADGTGNAARFYNPSGVALDSSGNLYAADETGCTIRKVTPAGVVTTLAGSPESCGWADGTGSTARFNVPSWTAVDGAGNVYVTDFIDDTIRKVTPDGTVTTIAGVAHGVGSADGTGSAALFGQPDGIAVDSSGNIYVADRFNNTIRKLVMNDTDSVTVGFTAPPSNGGSTITSYAVTSSPTGGTDSDAGSTSLIHTMTGLLNNTAYTFAVTATNAAGSSTASYANSVVEGRVPTPGGGGGAGSSGTTPGGVPILAIEGDATSTASSSVFLAIAIPYPASMAVANDTSFLDSSSIPAVGSLSWNLCTGLASCLPGVHTVYLKVTSLGGIAQTVSQSIDYEPAGTANMGSVTAASTTPVIASSTPASSSLPSSNAMVEELQILFAKLKSLQAQAGITPASGTALPASSTLSSYPFTRNLSLWDDGKDVTALQEFLIKNNAGTKARLLKSHGTSTTFAYLTLHALQEYQASVGLPATGFFGPLTRKKMGGE